MVSMDKSEDHNDGIAVDCNNDLAKHYINALPAGGSTYHTKNRACKKTGL